MAFLIVLEDGWDGHFALSAACHQAGHEVLAIQHPSHLQSTLRARPADVLVVDTAIPGVCMTGIGAIAADAGLPVVATGYRPWSPACQRSTFLPTPATSSALLAAVQAALGSREGSRAA